MVDFITRKPYSSISANIKYSLVFYYNYINIFFLFDTIMFAIIGVYNICELKRG